MLLHQQPPSGGCVLKQRSLSACIFLNIAAAFGRLCVETSPKMAKASDDLAAAFGRLCVETFVKCTTPSAFVGSRLRAAVC